MKRFKNGLFVYLEVLFLISELEIKNSEKEIHITAIDFIAIKVSGITPLTIFAMKNIKTLSSAIMKNSPIGRDNSIA